VTASPWIPSPALEGVPLYGYGHSYLAGLHNGIAPGQRYMERTARRLGMAYVPRAVSGYQMQDAALDLLNGPRAWTVGTSGVVVLDATINDTKNHGTDAQALRGYRWSLRAALRYLSLSSAIPEDSGSITPTGDGERIAVADFTGGHNWRMTAGQYGVASWSFTTTGSNMVIGFGGLDDSDGGEFDVLADGQVVAGIDTDNVCRTSATGRPYCPVTVQPTLADGPHSIAVRPRGTAATGKGPYLDYVGTLSKTPPLIVLVRPLPLPGDGYLLADAAAVEAYADVQFQEAATARAQGVNVVIVDPSPGWNPATMIGADGLHPSPRGHAHIADALCGLLAGYDYSRGVTR